MIVFAAGRGSPTDGGEGGGLDVRVRLGQSIRKLKQHWRLGALLACVLTCPQAGVAGEGSLAASIGEARSGSPAGGGPIMRCACV